uniref:exonuclease SbcCD subunit D n=1 Tax=Gemmiger formicilis TaxID=745368 RepID=UPI004028CD91
MKFFHLADLHIGKKVNGYSMIDDQRVLLDQIVAHLAADKPDALILAGDIYDRRNPPVEAVALFDDFVSRVVLEQQVPILAIGGNHDGGERLGFANAIQAKAGLHLVGSFTWPLPKVRLYDADGPVDVTLMAYADLAVLHALVPETAELDFPQAMDWVLRHTDLDPAARQVLVAHGVVTGDAPLETCDSERELSIGGTEYWQSASLAGFDYVALGHLHQAQRAGSERIRYAGSLMQYSFSEENQQKVMLSVTLDKDGALVVQPLPLVGPRRLVTVKGLLDELLSVPERVRVHQNDYLRVVLEDTGSLLEPMQRLKQCYPNIMLMERQALPEVVLDQPLPQAAEGTKRSPLDMFAAFYEQVMEEAPGEELCAVMKSVFDEVQKEDV